MRKKVTSSGKIPSAYIFGRYEYSTILVHWVMAGIFLFSLGLIVFLKYPDIQSVDQDAYEHETATETDAYSMVIDLEADSKQRVNSTAYLSQGEMQNPVFRKKNLFFEELLPFFMVSLREVQQERDFLLSVKEKLGDHWDDQYLISTFESVATPLLSKKERKRLLVLADQYRVASFKKLMVRVNTVPLSLMLAQAALESSWGDSRFAVEGNNFFGIWTWGLEGIVPKDRDDGKYHKVAQYSSILQSARAYLLILNRLRPYEKFRHLRLETKDPLMLAEGLMLYSERGQEYVDELKKIILTNNLERYDVY